MQCSGQGRMCGSLQTAEARRLGGVARMVCDSFWCCYCSNQVLRAQTRALRRQRRLIRFAISQLGPMSLARTPTVTVTEPVP